jgi:hypothetical protein
MWTALEHLGRTLERGAELAFQANPLVAYLATLAAILLVALTGMVLRHRYLMARERNRFRREALRASGESGERPTVR